MNTERIIEAVLMDGDTYWRYERWAEKEPCRPEQDYPPITTALANLAMSGVCNWCGLSHMRHEYRWDKEIPLDKAHRYRRREGKTHPYSFECANEFHDNREALEAALAAPSDALIAERG